MKKIISVSALSLLFVAGNAMAAGYRIPEQSVDSTAKSGANISSSTRADAAYYNPANMSWLDNTWQVQLDGTYIYLSSIDYDDSRSPMYSGSTEEENFFMPTGFVVSPSYGGAHIGLAIVAPYGLAKRWDSAYQKATAEEFSLTTYEVNPTVSYQIGEMVSIAAGPRMLYADATVKSDASGLGKPLSRNTNGDTVEWGWNAALSVKPMKELNLSVTYRSNIDMGFEDDSADLNLMGTQLSMGSTVTIPAPAVLALSASYDIMDNLTVEFTFDRTFWSEYDQLNFDYDVTIPGNIFDVPVSKDWDDANAYRLSVTYGVTKSLDVMLGFAYDESPISTSHVGFELPDSDAYLFSLGFQYAVSDNLDLGLSMLYDYKTDRTVENNYTDTVYGEFTGSYGLLVSCGLNYRF